MQGELAHPTLLLAQVVDSGDSLCLSGLSVELSFGRMTALLLFWVYLSALALAVALLVPPVQTALGSLTKEAAAVAQPLSPFGEGPLSLAES